MAKKQTEEQPIALADPPTHRKDPLLTFKEVAAQIGVSEQTIGRWATQHGRKRIKTVRLPSGRRKVRQSVVNVILSAVADNGDSTEEYREEEE